MLPQHGLREIATAPAEVSSKVLEHVRELQTLAETHADASHLLTVPA
jgi:hypothetical protein